MLSSTPLTAADARILHELYQQTPHYFSQMSVPIPTLQDVAAELELSSTDHRRTLELLWDNQECIGYLDYKQDYPKAGDVTINLLLISEQYQRRGYGRMAVRLLEKRMRGKAQRILASVFGKNPTAVTFWQNLGYIFAIDARPILEWYAKNISTTSPLPASA